MKVIFVSGSYSGGNYAEIQVNIEKSEIVSIELFKKDWSVFTPHKNTAHYDGYNHVKFTYNFWMDVGMELLKRSDAIFMMKDWEKSKGALFEKKLAEKLNIPVYYEKDGIPDVSKEVEIEIDINNKILLELTQIAHYQNITLNKLISNILRKYIEKDKYGKR